MQAQLTILECPGFVQAGQPFQAVFQVVNTGPETLPCAGPNPVHIGSQQPIDNATWGTSRIYLHQDVLPGQTIPVTATLTAPKTPGVYAFAWEMLQEGIAWGVSPAVAQSLVVPYLNPLPADPGDGSIVGQNIIETGPYQTNSGNRQLTWTHTGGRFGILIAAAWAGLDPGAVADMSFGVAHGRTGSLVGWLPLDRYSAPSVPDMTTFNFPEPGIILNPGDQLIASMFVNANPVTQAAHALSIWGKYL